jgi:tetratricopeptide (TPR) repeat protein
VEAVPAEEAGARIGRSTVAAELAAVLDEWAAIRRQIRGGDDPSWKALLRVARAADPDVWRTRVREALERWDRQALRELAASEEVFRHPAATLSELGTALLEDKAVGGQSEAFLREAQRRHPNDFWLNCNLFSFFYHMQPPQPEEAYLFAAVMVAVRPESPGAHYNLGLALYAKGRLDEAIAEYREAIRIKKDFAEAHCNLGVALTAKGRLDEAIAEYREALRIKKDYAEAHCNLGHALLRQGQFRQAVDELRRGHELGSRQPGWRHPSAAWLRNAEILADLDARLPALLKKKEQPKDAQERLALAQLCQWYKKLSAASARWYSEAFAENPQLAEDLRIQARYNAACVAALAGCGQGKDADQLDDKERARLRQQALDWLRADLKANQQVIDKAADKAGPAIAQRMQHWLQDADFGGVRDAAALARLREAERADWQRLWQEVEALRQRAVQSSAPASTARP